MFIPVRQKGRKGRNFASAQFLLDSSPQALNILNAAGVKAGEFPGSILIPGSGNVSIAIGGFIKTVAIFDSDAENMGADFLPATLGTRRPDTQGGFSLDATLTRLFLDGRAPVPRGKVRGYLEADFNNANDGSLGVKKGRPTASGSLTPAHSWPARPGRP